MSPPPHRTDPNQRQRFARLAWAVLFYCIFVVLFGAVVRITGSGAGCGQHWPTCQGEVAHLPRTIEAAIELTHRVTSGISVVLVMLLPVFAVRLFPRGHVARRAALASFAFMIIEALIGALLVLFRLVADDVSIARAVILPLHLTNTSLLLGALVITGWSSARERLPLHWPRRGSDWLLPLGLLGTLLISGTGAITALGDTLFPVHGPAVASDPFSEGWGPLFLQRMRIVHPVLAVLGALYLLYVLRLVAAGRPGTSPTSVAPTSVAPTSVAPTSVAPTSVAPTSVAPTSLAPTSLAQWAWLARVMILLQLVAGALNVLLGAPPWMQVVHLGLGVGVWIVLVMVWAASSVVKEVGEAAPQPSDVTRLRPATAEPYGWNGNASLGGK